MSKKRILVYTYKKYDSNVLFFINKMEHYVDKIVLFDCEKIENLNYDIYANFEDAIDNNKGFDEYILANDLFYGPFYDLDKLFEKMSYSSFWSINQRFFDYKSFVVFSKEDYEKEKNKVDFFSNEVVDVDRAIIEDRCPFLHKSYFYKNEHILFFEKLRRIFDFLKSSSFYNRDIILENLIKSDSCKTINSSLAMNYVISSTEKEKSLYSQKKVAVVMYIYLESLVEFLYQYASNLPKNIDIYVVTTSNSVLKKIELMYKQLHNYIECRIQINRGRDNTALFVTSRDLFEKYDYLCFVHSKESQQNKITGSEFRNHCLDSLLYNHNYVNNLLNKFEENKLLGLVVPYPPEFEPYCTVGNEWLNNYENAQEVVKTKINEDIFLPENDVVCAFGNMYWLRTDAFKTLLKANFTFDDFPEEPLPQYDGLLTHSIERIIPSVVAYDGFYTSYVIPDVKAPIYINTLMNSIKKLKNS